MDADATALALIAHDLKNALGSLESELEGLIDNPTPAAVQGAKLRCSELRRQFVQFLTIYQAGNLQAMSEDESPVELLKAFHRTARAKAMSGGTTAKVVLGAMENAPPFWYFDHRLVQLALEAAFHNASNFAQTIITLDLRLEDGCLVFVVDDDGPGMGSGKTSSLSTGLGTLLCQAVAHAHQCGERQGKVRVFNRPEGGVRFELWLP